MIWPSPSFGRPCAAAWWCGVLSSLALAADAIGRAGPDRPPAPALSAAVLDLGGDGFVAGSLAPTPAGGTKPRATLLWRSPLFAEPIEFAVDAIERIRFPRVEVQRTPAATWRVGLRNGGFAIGGLEAIDADHVILTAAHVSDRPLRIRRGAIEQISNEASAAKVFVPGGLRGWDMARGEWQEQAGRLVGDKAGSAAHRDVSAAARACFDLVLSWDARPEFEVFFADDANRPKRPAGDRKTSAAERYRLDLLGGDLLAIRESATRGEFDPIGRIPAGGGGLHVQVFVDQQVGRMAVVLPESESGGEAVFDETLAPRKPGNRTGFGIRLRTGGVRIDSLQVTDWTDPKPRRSAAGRLGGPDAALEAFDKSQGLFTFRGAEGPRQVPAAEVSLIEFPENDDTTPETRAGSVAAAFHGGTRLPGRLLEVTEDSIRLDCPALADPLVCRFGLLAAIESLSDRRPEKLPGRAGQLEAESGQMVGCLASAAGPEGGIAWQPLGAMKPVAFGGTMPVRISYSGTAAPGGAGAAADGQATVYLKTGDSFTCKVVSADADGLRIRDGLGDERVVPTVVLRAVELTTGAASGIPKEKLARLLTLPRMQQSDPPTHMLRLPNGDYLRGKLVSLDDSSVRIDVLGVVKEMPRAGVTRLIWLSVEGDASEARALDAVIGKPAGRGVPIRATMYGGRRLSLVAERLQGNRLVGTNGAIGPIDVDLARCERLDLLHDAAEALPGTLPYSQWKLRPAAVPRSVQKDGVQKDGVRQEGVRNEQAAPSSPGPPTATPTAASPLSGKPVVLPTMPLLESGTEGRGKPFTLGEGRIGVLALVDVSDGPALERLPRLAEAVAGLEPDGVVCSAIISRGSREEVTRAVSGLNPKPPITIDPSGQLRKVWGEPVLPACLLVDREGRVADLLPLEDGDVGKIRARAEALVAGSREIRREFESLDRAKKRLLDNDRGCLTDLVGLLDADAETVRRQSIAYLRLLGGMGEKEMPFTVDGPKDRRAEQVRTWRRWLAREGISVNLVFPRPLEAAWADGRPITGRTLVCRPQNGDAVELDEAGGEVLSMPAKSGWACDVTPQGNRLIGEHVGKAVLEYDATGTVVWAVRNLPGGPMSARRLENGNTLVALSDADLVAEYDPQGAMVWSAKVEGRPCDARRLPTGVTLVAAHRADRIVEITREGTEVWSVEGIDDPQTAQRLPNGNTLVAMSVPGIVREIDREGRTIWQKEGFRVPTDVQRLPNGVTLVQEQEGDLVELDAVGVEVARETTGGSRFVRF